jgi:hypothetical protein
MMWTAERSTKCTRSSTPPVIRPSAEITVDGKPWGKPENIEITANDLWTGFVVDLKSATGEKLKLVLPRGGSKGKRVTGSDLDVGYTRGKETWIEYQDSAVANITDYNRRAKASRRRIQ